MAMVKNLYQIADDAKELRDEIHKTIDVKGRKKTDSGEISIWASKSLELLGDLAKKADEIMERLVRLEDEVRKDARPELLRKRK